MRDKTEKPKLSIDWSWMKPRNPKRITGVLAVIKQIWEKDPDLRLMQLLLNVTKIDGAYNLEDDELVKRLKELYKL